jgi:hypothetical protein
MTSTINMSDYLLRGMKLQNMLETLSPSPVGSIEDFGKSIKMAHSRQSPIDAEIDVKRPLHHLLKDISLNVIDFMRDIKTKKRGMMEFPRGVDAYLLRSHPMIHTLMFKMMVKYPNVVVRDITGKGKGVVATADISANSIVTFYPNDIIRVRCYESTPDLKGGMSVSFSAHAGFRDHAQINEINKNSDRLNDYKFTISNVDIYGDPSMHPNGCCGHMINDGDGPVKGMNNSVLVPLFGGAMIAVVAVFDIQKGSEVMTSYGTGYWKTRIQ